MENIRDKHQALKLLQLLTQSKTEIFMPMYQFSHTLGMNDLTSTNGELLTAPEEDEMGTK